MAEMVMSQNCSLPKMSSLRQAVSETCILKFALVSEFYINNGLCCILEMFKYQFDILLSFGTRAFYEPQR